MLTVYLGCFFLYGETPKELFEKAQKGSLEAIKKLLRIDPSVLGDALIFEHFHRASMNESRSTFNEIVYSLGHPPKEKITLEQTKFKIAGLISSASENLKMKFKSTEIELFFDTFAEQFNREQLKLVNVDDPEKIPFNKNITQKIRRYRNFWK